jgi:hypothetical protein
MVEPVEWSTRFRQLVWRTPVAVAVVVVERVTREQTVDRVS